MKELDMLEGTAVAQKDLDLLFDDSAEQVKIYVSDAMKRENTKVNLYANFILTYQLANNCYQQYE